MQRTIHVHQNDNAILRVAFLLVLSFTLTGCALTRVSASSHDKDVDELNRYCLADSRLPNKD